jgi:O-antigen/teichoic acid export membrane protein
MPSNFSPTSSPGRISLKQRVLNAGAWRLSGYGLSQVIRFGSNLLMTRLLMPEMFGVMAIATTVIAGLAMFSDVGLKPSIIRSKRGSDPSFLNTAWVTQILRGVVLWVFALCVALLVFIAARLDMVPKNSIYAEPTLPYVIAMLSVTPVVSGFQSTKLFEASRSLSIGRVTQIEIIAQVAGLLCMLGWASIDRSIWALVVGAICGTLVTAVMSHVWLPGVTNRWQWEKSAYREIIHFGKWIFISSILGFLVINGDRLLLGGLVDANVFGVYVIAFLIFNSIDQVLTNLIAEVSFPALSEIAREQPHRLKASYYRFHAVIASFAYLCSGILMALGQPLIALLYDPRYDQAGWMLEVLAAALVTVPFRAATQCFMALGMPHLLSNIIAIRLITLFVLTLIGFHFFGLVGALSGIVLSHFSYLPAIMFYSAKNGLLDGRKEALLLPLVLVGFGVGKLFAIGIGR